MNEILFDLFDSKISCSNIFFKIQKTSVMDNFHCEPLY